MQRTRANTGCWRGSSDTSPPATRPRTRTGSIATDGSPARQSFRLPSRLLLFLDPPDRFFQLPHVVACQFPGFRELRHHRLRPSAEQAQDVVEQPVTRDVAGNERLEDVGVADLPHAAHGTFGFKPVDRRLNRGVGRPRLRKLLLDFADRGLSERPEHLENLQFQSREFGWCSGHLLSRPLIYY